MLMLQKNCKQQCSDAAAVAADTARKEVSKLSSASSALASTGFLPVAVRLRMLSHSAAVG